MAGNYLLMMFYTTIAGWMVQYFIKMMTGEFEGKDTAAVAGVFSDMLAKPGTMTFFMIIVVLQFVEWGFKMEWKRSQRL